MRKAVWICAALLVWAGAAQGADNSFFRILSSKPNATFEDACKGFAMLAGVPVTEDFGEFKSQLAARKIIPAKWAEEKTAEERLTRGVMAYMVCTSLEIKGGMMMRLLGPSQRYSLRECVYLKLIARSAESKLVTGGELLAVLHRVDKYKREHVEGEEVEQ